MSSDGSELQEDEFFDEASGNLSPKLKRRNPATSDIGDGSAQWGTDTDSARPGSPQALVVTADPEKERIEWERREARKVTNHPIHLATWRRKKAALWNQTLPRFRAQHAREKKKVAAREAQVANLKKSFAYFTEIEIGFDRDHDVSSRLMHYVGAKGKNIKALTAALHAQGVAVLLDDTRHCLFLACSDQDRLRRSLAEMAASPGEASLLCFYPTRVELNQMLKPIILASGC